MDFLDPRDNFHENITVQLISFLNLMVIVINTTLIYAIDFNKSPHDQLLTNYFKIFQHFILLISGVMLRNQYFLRSFRHDFVMEANGTDYELLYISHFIRLFNVFSSDFFVTLFVTFLSLVVVTRLLGVI